MRIHALGANAPPRLNKLRLCGAEIRGNLDMRGCSLVDAKQSLPLFADGLTVHGHVLLSDGFSAVGEIRLNGCNIYRNLDCSGASLSNPGGYSLSAAGAHIKGSAYFSETQEWITYPARFPFVSHGILRLEGTTIDGDLDCTAGTFFATAFLPMEIHEPKDGSENIETRAIAADGLRVGADLIFSSSERGQDRFVVHGAISLISANVGGDFNCDKATYDFPGEEPLVADGITIAGTTFLDEVSANGTLRFIQANLKQGLFIDDTSFDVSKECKSWTQGEKGTAALDLGGPACGIYAPDAEVGKVFRWKRIKKIVNNSTKPNPFWLFLACSKLPAVEDDQQSWEALDRFNVTGCEYRSIYNLSDADVDWRLDILDRQYARINVGHRWPDLILIFSRVIWRLRGLAPNPFDNLVKQFSPEPYIQLAKTFRAAGYETSAKAVLTRLERNRTRYSDIGFLFRLWRRMLDVLLRYGYSPFRPVLILIAWALFSAVVFQTAYDQNQIIAARDNQAIPTASDPSPRPRTAFNAFVYAVDTLVPIVDLNQKKSWTVKRLSAPPIDSAGQGRGWLETLKVVWRSRPEWGPGLLLIFNTFFGWLMTTLFAAGVTGLLRTGKDG